MYLTLPKTIDNDLAETEISFGFQSAVDIATNALDCIHTTAASHTAEFLLLNLWDTKQVAYTSCGYSGG